MTHGTPDADLRRALDSPEAAVRRRARLVAHGLAEGSAAAAAHHGVSTRTVSTCVRRYRTEGIRALMGEAQRRQRRASLQRDIRTAPLRSATAKWSSRSIAQELGVSQSAVARAWRSTSVPTDVLGRIRAWAGKGSASLAAVLIAPGCSIVVLTRSPAPRVRASATANRITRHCRTLLAADLTRDGITEDGDGDELAATFWERVMADATAPADVLAVSSVPVTLSASGIETHACDGEEQWQGMLETLVELCAEDAEPALADLEARIRRWHHHENDLFVWHAPARGDEAEPRATTDRTAAQSPSVDAPGERIEDQIIALVRSEITAGRFAGGDFVTERFLADRLDASRGQVREALRSLTDSGLATTQTLHGLTIPIPTPEDVVELYSARRALGAIAVRAAVSWTPEGRAAVARLLQELETAAAADDMAAVHRIDLQFQDALARASTLRRIPALVEGLSQQLLMFVAAFGVRYAYPITDIVDRDQEIFRALDAGDEAAALDAWRRKSEGSACYMLHQLSTTLRQRP